MQCAPLSMLNVLEENCLKMVLKRWLIVSFSVSCRAHLAGVTCDYSTDPWLLQVDLSIDDMDVDILKRCFQLRLENIIIYLLKHCGCRSTLQLRVSSSGQSSTNGQNKFCDIH